MNTRLRRNTFRCVCASALTALLAACGDPGSGTPFTFNPLPLATLESGTLVSFDPSTCSVYVAGEALAIVEDEHVDDLRAWLIDENFTIISDMPSFALNVHTLLIGVPKGAEPDAARVIGVREGVVASDPNGVGKIPEAPPLIVCTPQAGQ